MKTGKGSPVVAALVVAAGCAQTPTRPSGSAVVSPIAIPACQASTLSPVSRSLTPAGSQECSEAGSPYETVNVTTSLTTCRWTAHIDVDWLSFACYGNQSSTFDPGNAGRGQFWYVVAPNYTANTRTGHVVVSFTDGSKIAHTVTVEAPECTYTVTPPGATFTGAGGTGAFDIVATPPSCEWLAKDNKNAGVEVTSANQGIGSGHVTYLVRPSHGETMHVTKIVVQHPSPTSVYSTGYTSHTIQINYR